MSSKSIMSSNYIENKTNSNHPIIKNINKTKVCKKQKESDKIYNDSYSSKYGYHYGYRFDLDNHYC
jgi:hypothetical protein